MAQHAILRFEKHKGNPARPLEAHHERQKEQYASNPDIDTSRSKYNFHIVKPEGRYYHFIQSRIEQAGCRTRKDSTRFVDTLVTASPEFFKGKSPKEIQAFFQRAAAFLIGRVGRENIVSAVVHMDEKTPHLAFDLCSADKGQPPVCKGDYRQPGKPDEVGRTIFTPIWWRNILTWSVGKAPARQAGSISPPGFSNRRFPSPNRPEPLKPPLTALTPLNAGKKKEEAPFHAEKVVPADGKLLRAVEKSTRSQSMTCWRRMRSWKQEQRPVKKAR